MGGVFSSLTEIFADHMERQRNRPFLEGVMAACALVATVDGEVSFAEQVRVDQILGTLGRLQVFDPHEGVDLFKTYTDAILKDPQEGHADALETVAKVADTPKDGALLLRVCLAISEADGDAGLADQIEIVSMCSRFGIDPADCGLYIDKPIEELLQVRAERDLKSV